jgi:hypothetical protein
MNITRRYVADFGRSRAGLATVGYTLSGGSRVTAGVSEVASGSGKYMADVAHPAEFRGVIYWDSGEVDVADAVEAINPATLGPDGLDAVPGFGASNARQTTQAIAAVLYGPRSGVPAAGSGGTITLGGGYGTIAVDTAGNITASAVTPPA